MPFVENSFKHGLNLKATDGWVNIVLKVDGGRLFFCIKNNKGIKESVKADDVGGIGLKNVKKRLEILYPGKHGLRITDDNGVYEVQLTLELV
jgi:sensor histidine kinase YesM